MRALISLFLVFVFLASVLSFPGSSLAPHLNEHPDRVYRLFQSPLIRAKRQMVVPEWMGIYTGTFYPYTSNNWGFGLS
ncbi:hypothetical protein L596_021683 [Steinernema carpocapsae]|uniref:Uncharacterized protein n=1 Tax=Steinernema carpocapsae TaxID=34508 RepID=A0A4U5MJI8_STECR|nr:hypothetical protein L596_021683 [Steinernema carpocapsae]